MVIYKKVSLSLFTSSLRSRLFFLICLATFPAIIFSFFLADRERTDTLSRIELDAQHLASLASREHANQIGGAHDLLGWLGKKLIKEGPNSLIIKDPDFLKTLLAGHPQLSNVGILDPDGGVLVSAYPFSNYRGLGDNPAFLAALKSNDIVTGTYLISPIFERPTLNHAYAVRDSQHRVWAVLFNGLNLEWLSEVTKQSGLPKGFSLIITDRDGQILAHSESNNNKDKDWENYQIPDISEISKSQKGKMLKINGLDIYRYFVALPLKGAEGLYVAVSLPYENVIDQAASSFYRTLISLAILTFITIALVFFSAELWILRTLRSLVYTVQRFGEGDFSIRATTPRGKNELVSLTEAFNKMADSLVARQKETNETKLQLRALAGRLQMAREEEAARISRELHDEIGQMLTSLKIDLASIQSHLNISEEAKVSTNILSESITTMNQHIALSIDFVRRICSDLRPGVLDKLGLIAAIEWQAREIESRTKLVVQVDAEVIEQQIDENISVTLFRIVQEALTNIVRHAQANMVEIKIVSTGEALELIIKDDGVGIDLGSLENFKSLGIIGMRERVSLIGGQLFISRDEKQGTIVTVRVLLNSNVEV